MMARRPFGDRQTLLTAARDEWFALGPADWREAFGHHPKIGDRDAAASKFAATRHLSKGEQERVQEAAVDLLARLAEANRVYEERFGYIFIVCASGRTAAEMLALLNARLHNDPETELRIAAAEQAAITTLRLERMSGGEA
jgi:2-oxo-4-hydroxy-4-carboxy-5-ureidoimidazoline decarboxylase